MGGIGAKLCETFTYDSLDRLDTVRRNGTLTLDANHDLSGNLTSRSDVGSYTYHATKKHAVTAAGSNSFAYDANGNVITRNGATLGWASYGVHRDGLQSRCRCRRRSCGWWRRISCN